MLRIDKARVLLSLPSGSGVCTKGEYPPLLFQTFRCFTFNPFRFHIFLANHLISCTATASTMSTPSRASSSPCPSPAIPTPPLATRTRAQLRSAAIRAQLNAATSEKDLLALVARVRRPTIQHIPLRVQPSKSHASREIWIQSPPVLFLKSEVATSDPILPVLPIIGCTLMTASHGIVIQSPPVLIITIEVASLDFIIPALPILDCTFMTASLAPHPSHMSHSLWSVTIPDEGESSDKVIISTDLEMYEFSSTLSPHKAPIDLVHEENKPSMTGLDLQFSETGGVAPHFFLPTDLLRSPAKTFPRSSSQVTACSNTTTGFSALPFHGVSPADVPLHSNSAIRTFDTAKRSIQLKLTAPVGAQISCPICELSVSFNATKCNLTRHLQERHNWRDVQKFYCCSSCGWESARGGSGGINDMSKHLLSQHEIQWGCRRGRNTKSSILGAQPASSSQLPDSDSPLIDLDESPSSLVTTQQYPSFAQPVCPDAFTSDAAFSYTRLPSSSKVPEVEVKIIAPPIIPPETASDWWSDPGPRKIELLNQLAPQVVQYHTISAEDQFHFLESQILPRIISKAGGRVGKSSIFRRPVCPVPDIEQSSDPGPIQGLYRKDRKKCLEFLLKRPSQACSIPVPELESHFSKSFAPPDSDAATRREVINSILPPPPESSLPLDVAPFTCQEIAAAFKSHGDSSPGEDKVVYSRLKDADPSFNALSFLFNSCLIHRKVPAAWKSANLSLVFKKGDPTDPANWRPIALSSVIGKVYTRLWAMRLTSLITASKILSQSQKGFLPGDGIAEHIWVAHSLIQQNTPGTSIAFIDLRDAFGSVPHDVILSGLDQLGLPPAFIEVVKDLYDGASVKARSTPANSPPSFTDPIPMSRGVRQGDPLSPLLFIIALEPVLRLATLQDQPVICYGEAVGGLAYADDLLLCSSSPRALQALLIRIDDLIRRLGMAINPAKCGTLVLGREVQEQFCIGQGVALPSLSKGESYTYLGRALGESLSDLLGDSFDQLEKDIITVFDSNLSPYQKTDALKIFLLPRLSHILRTNPSLSISGLKEFNYKITNRLKKVLQLPPSASLDYLQAPVTKGGLGLLLPAQESDLQTCTQAFRILTSPDNKIRRIASNQLVGDLSLRLKLDKDSQPTTEQIEDFLNGRFCGHGKGERSIWFFVGKAVRRLEGIHLKISVLSSDLSAHDPTFTFSHPSSLPEPCRADASSRKSVFKALRIALQHSAFISLLTLSFQGSAFHAIAADASSSSFNRDGRFISLPSAIFSHKARLGLLPVNGQPGRRHAKAKAQRVPTPQSAEEASCRKCRESGSFLLETTAHILSHCPSHLASGITVRHNNVLKLVHRELLTSLLNIRTSDSSQWSIIVDSPLAVAGRAVRPDLVCINEKEKRAVILDVTCPFEHTSSSFQEAREKKLCKYGPELEALIRQGFRVHLNAIVVGTLGSWDPGNDASLVLCGITGHKLVRLKRASVCAALDASRTIFFKHTMGDRYNLQDQSSSPAPCLAYLSCRVPNMLLPISFPPPTLLTVNPSPVPRQKTKRTIKRTPLLSAEELSSIFRPITKHHPVHLSPPRDSPMAPVPLLSEDELASLDAQTPTDRSPLLSESEETLILLFPKPVVRTSHLLRFLPHHFALYHLRTFPPPSLYRSKR